MNRRIVFLAVVFVVASSVAWAAFRDTRSDNERAAVEYSQQVKIAGFRLTDSDIRSEDVTLTYVGDDAIDLASAISAPGLGQIDQWPPIGGTEVSFEPLADVRGIPYRGLSCRVGVDRLRPGRKPDDTWGLSGDEMKEVSAGRATVVMIHIGCRPPINTPTHG